MENGKNRSRKKLYMDLSRLVAESLDVHISWTKMHVTWGKKIGEVNL